MLSALVSLPSLFSALTVKVAVPAAVGMPLISPRYDTLPEKAEEFRKNLELFHDYVRGGIEVMYEQFTDGCQTQDDYLSKTYEVMTTFKKELEGVSYADEIAHLIK